MTTLLFVDTNIFLDFYRLASREAGLSILAKLEQKKEILITGDQVAMEFKKNRQRVILDTHKTLKAPDWQSLALPPILSATKSSRAIEKYKRGVKAQSERLKSRLLNVLKKPSSYDPVFKAVQRLMKHRGPYNLSRDKDCRLSVRELAKKRFLLGYPPRKVGDTSIGDAINWEWIVECASASGAGVILVSRDSDYGVAVRGELVLNDWLREEFRSRVSKKRSILLTDRLSVALRGVDVRISKRETDAEDLVLKLPTSPSQERLDRTLMRLLGYPLEGVQDPAPPQDHLSENA